MRKIKLRLTKSIRLFGHYIISRVIHVLTSPLIVGECFGSQSGMKRWVFENELGQCNYVLSNDCLFYHDTQIARGILFSEHIWPFFETYVHLPNFDVASDSFATLR